MVFKHASESFNCLIDCVYLCVCFLTAPSVVPIMHQVSSTSRSFSLSWPPPEQPNGIILDYEIRYYDKVEWDDKCLWVFVCVCVLFGVTATASNPLESIKQANQYQLHLSHLLSGLLLRSSNSLTASQILQLIMTWIKVIKSIKLLHTVSLIAVYLQCVCLHHFHQVYGQFIIFTQVLGKLTNQRTTKT